MKSCQMEWIMHSQLVCDRLLNWDGQDLPSLLCPGINRRHLGSKLGRQFKHWGKLFMKNPEKQETIEAACLIFNKMPLIRSSLSSLKSERLRIGVDYFEMTIAVVLEKFYINLNQSVSVSSNANLVPSMQFGCLKKKICAFFFSMSISDLSEFVQCLPQGQNVLLKAFFNTCQASDMTKELAEKFINLFEGEVKHYNKQVEQMVKEYEMCRTDYKDIEALISNVHVSLEVYKKTIGLLEESPLFRGYWEKFDLAEHYHSIENRLVSIKISDIDY